MRIAVISDIHGNSAALDAVLADIAEAGVDLTVNLGDCFSGPLDPAGTAERLLAIDAPTVIGNHDRWLIDRPHAEMGAWEKPVFPLLSEAALTWLRALPKTLEIEGLFFCHGTPSSDETFWLDQKQGDRMAMAPREAIEAEAWGITAPVILCGHTHIPRAIRLGDGRLVVNPGSVGCPGYTDRRPPAPYAMSMGAPDARYAILERRGGIWRPEFRALPYDAAPMVALAEKAGDADWASALASGWVTL